MTIVRPAAFGGIPAADSAGSYPVKTNAVAGFSGAGMSSSQVMEILRRLDPGAVADAGAAHAQLGAVLDQVANRLTQHAQALAEHWSGSAAQAAMGKFQQLHDQMTVLSRQATQVGSVLTWLGTQVLPWAKALPDPSTGSVSSDIFGGGGQAADERARQYISTLSEYLVQANDNLPDTIGNAGAYPPRGTGNSPSGAASGAGSVSGAGPGQSSAGSGPAGGGIGGTRSPGLSGSGPPSPGSAGFGSGTTPAAVPVSSLQGMPSPVSTGPSSVLPGAPVTGAGGTGAAGVAGGVAGVAGVAGGSALSGAPVSPGVSAVPGGLQVPASPEASGVPVPDLGLGGMGGVSSASGPVSGDAPAPAGTAESADPSAAGGRDAGRATAGFPMGGAAAGQPERDRRRHAWMYEDDEIWGADGTDCVPPVIYGDEWQSPNA